jgi:hypothetical protein
MATVLQECTTKEQRSVVHFLWSKGLNAKDIHKEMFPVYGGKCLSHKEVQNLVEKFSQRHSTVADDAQPGCLLRLQQKQLCSEWKSSFELTE